MKYQTLFLFVAAIIMSIGITGCHKQDSEKRRVLNKLYKTYKQGTISEWTYKGELVYSAGLNGYDAGGAIFDKNGNKIGSCNYAWGPVDSICGQLANCEVIYRVKGNIWGQPAVDKYGLKRFP